MLLEISQAALADIQGVHSFGVAKFGTLRADDYVIELLDVLDIITSQPKLAHERNDILDGLRVHPHKSHLILYKLEFERVVILRLFHGSTNWREQL